MYKRYRGKDFFSLISSTLVFGQLFLVQLMTSYLQEFILFMQIIIFFLQEFGLLGNLNVRIFYIFFFSASSSVCDDNAYKTNVFQVTAENDMYISQESSHVLFHITTVDSELKVEVKNKTSSSVTLAWNTVKGVDGYIVCRDRPENVYLMGNVTANTSESSMQGKYHKYHLCIFFLALVTIERNIKRRKIEKCCEW